MTLEEIFNATGLRFKDMVNMILTAPDVESLEYETKPDSARATLTLSDGRVIEHEAYRPYDAVAGVVGKVVKPEWYEFKEW